MNQKSAKAKGNRFQQYLCKRLRETVDVNTHETPSSGSGYDKQDIRIPSLNIEIEAKNAATFSIGADWEQTKNQITTGNMGILAVRHPKKPEFTETLIIMDFEDWITLVQGQKEERSVSFTADKDSKWKVQRMVESAKQVIKLYE